MLHNLLVDPLGSQSGTLVFYEVSKDVQGQAHCFSECLQIRL